jgi:hypothetical protein
MVTSYTSSFDKTIAFTEVSYPFHLTANVVTTITLPGTQVNKYVLTFGVSSNSNVFIGYQVTPTVPAGDSAPETAREEYMIPGMQRYAFGGNVISLISPDTAAYGSVTARAIPNPRT